MGVKSGRENVESSTINSHRISILPIQSSTRITRRYGFHRVSSEAACECKCSCGVVERVVLGRTFDDISSQRQVSRLLPIYWERQWERVAARYSSLVHLPSSQTSTSRQMKNPASYLQLTMFLSARGKATAQSSSTPYCRTLKFWSRGAWSPWNPYCRSPTAAPPANFQRRSAAGHRPSACVTRTIQYGRRHRPRCLSPLDSPLSNCFALRPFALQHDLLGSNVTKRP